MKNKIQNKQNKKFAKGFTLLELLVVVIIIGILAAIALPQYKMAVLKSQFATVKQNTKMLWDANQRYFLANGVYTTNISNLDVIIKNTDTIKYSIKKTNDVNGGYILNDGRLGYWIYGEASVLCTFSSDNTSVFKMLGNFCKQETNGGKKGCSSSTSCYYYYNKK